MSQGLNRPETEGRIVRTPDGRVFAAQPGRSARRIAGVAARRFLAVVRSVLAGLWKFVRTVWRLAEALDSALWRGAKLAAASLARFLSATGRTTFAAFGEVFRWLPSRGGRAYAAGSGVVLALCALWTADEIRNARSASADFDSIFRPPLDLDDPIVARVDGRYIHLSEIESAARANGQILDGDALTVDAAFARDLVGAYVEQRLLARAAMEEGRQRDPAVQRRLAAARDRILAAAYMEDRIKTAVTPDRVKRLYESQADVTRLGDEVSARHILVATEAEALAVIDEIRAGGDFASLARARSLDRATAPLGGEIGWFTKDMMTPPFAAAAFSTAVGDIAAPFSSEFGWHVLKVDDRRPTGGVSFEAVEDEVRRFLTMRAISQTLDALKEDEDVTYFPPETSAE